MKSLKSKITNPIAVCLIALLCCALWGSAFPVIKIGYGLFNIESNDYSSQILFAGLRFALAGALTVIFGSIGAKKLLTVKPRGYYKIVLLALFQTILQYLFFYIGLARTTGTKGSIINSVSVFFSVIIASLIIKSERLSLKKVIGCVIGFVGVAVINLSNGTFDTSVSFFGEGFIMLSALSYAVSSVLIKSFSVKDNPVALSGYQFAFGGLCMIVIGFFMGGRITFSGIKPILILLYLAMLSAVAYTLWAVLLKYNDVSRVTVFGFMTPVFGCILSALLLKEDLTGGKGYTLLSLFLVCIGIYLVNSVGKKSKKE